MNKEYYHANEIREEPTWSGGGVSLNGSHVTLPKVTELKSPEPVQTCLFHRIYLSIFITFDLINNHNRTFRQHNLKDE